MKGTILTAIAFFMAFLNIAQTSKVSRPKANATKKTISISMVSVPGGTFTMGCQEHCIGNDQPAHQVKIKGFMIGKFEVTRQQWDAVMGSTLSKKSDGDLPVEKVSWNEVQTFITKLNSFTGKKYRLPTEAEWEYAARGGDNNRSYSYSGSNNFNDVGWDYENSNVVKKVGMKKPNDLGIFDMSGNVYEWCSDWYGPYSAGLQVNPQGPTRGDERVCRGGASFSPRGYCTVFSRTAAKPNDNEYNGFRLALSL